MIEASFSADLTLAAMLTVVAGIGLWVLLTRPVSYWRN